MTRVGHYIAYETLSHLGGHHELIGGPYESYHDAIEDRDRIIGQAVKAGYRLTDGGYTRLTVEVGDTLPPSRFTPLLRGTTSMPPNRPRLPYPFSARS